MPNVSESLTQKGFAALCDVSMQTVSNWCEAGMPHEGGGGHGSTRKINVRLALPWLVTNRTEKPGSERERLAREQADKLALDNAERRGELLLREQYDQTVTNALDTLKQIVMGMPGRRASEISGMDDPAKCRALLMDEARQILDTYTNALTKLADEFDRLADEADETQTPTKTDGKRVGKGKPNTPKG